MTDDKLSGPKQQVRTSVGTRLETGSLPPDTGQRIFGSRGDGTRCACCDQPITASEVQYDMDSSSEDGEVPLTVSMHLTCYEVWVQESGIRRIRMLEPELADVDGATTQS
jgi:hypothetical protein